MNDISWGLLPVEASAIYYNPSSLLGILNNKSKVGAGACPAVLKLLQNTFSVKCPFDFHIKFTGTLNNPQIRPVLEGCSITPDKFANIFSLSPREDWLNPLLPVFQITTPYVFFSSKPNELIQRFPRELIGKGFPFRLIEGQFPIDTWKRPLSWAVEWIDLKKDIKFKRGIPWFDISFISENINANTRLKKINLKQEDLEELMSNKEVTKYIKGTSKLMER